MELERYETRLRQQSGFVREQVPYGNLPQNTECAVINLYDEVTYQQLLGFGGAFTESAHMSMRRWMRKPNGLFAPRILTARRASAIISAARTSIPAIFRWTSIRL